MLIVEQISLVVSKINLYFRKKRQPHGSKPINRTHVANLKKLSIVSALADDINWLDSLT